MKKSLSHFVVKFIYADHNSSFSVKKELRSIFKEADIGAKVLNIGSGNVRIHPKIVNIDIFQGENIDISCDIQLAIPIDSNSVDWIITQECFEHLRSPGKALYECFRVLRNNGKIYFQVPFIIGYHPGPHDYYRFTKEG